MSNKNDRWSALSLKDRADLMNMYLTNGINELSEMRKHYNSVPYMDFNSYGGGGNIEDHTIGEEEAASSFNVNWYAGRAPQLRKAMPNSYYANMLMPGKKPFENYKKMTDDRIVQLVTDNLKDELSGVKEFTTKEALNDYNARKILTEEYYARFPKEKPNEDKDFIGPPTPVPNDRLEPSIRRMMASGVYYPQHNTILYDSVFGGDNTTKIHERTHATVGLFSPILREVFGIVNDLKVRRKRIDPYYDDPQEIYARLMSFREKHNLDPTKVITKEDIDKWKKDKVEDFFLINRYPIDILLRLFNDVAQNTTDPNRLDYINPANIAAYGGRILDGTETEQTTTGLPVGAGLETYNHPKYNHTEEAEMYSYLRSRGVSHIQASSVMGNIAVESMLNPEITQIGGGGGYGLIQATDRSRKNAFINYDGQPYEFGSNISPETQRQLDYIIDKGLNTQTRGEWRGNHNIGRASVARRKFLEATDVNKASTIFTENYLRPGKPHTKRRKSMSNYFNDNYGITERALEEFENSFLFQNN